MPSVPLSSDATIPRDSFEYLVKAILAETSRKYLIDWEDDALTGEKYLASWEPKENANQEVVDDWERKRPRPKQQKQKMSLEDKRKEKARTVQPRQLEIETARQLRAAKRDATRPAASSLLFEPSDIGDDRDATGTMGSPQRRNASKLSSMVERLLVVSGFTREDLVQVEKTFTKKCEGRKRKPLSVRICSFHNLKKLRN